MKTTGYKAAVKQPSQVAGRRRVQTTVRPGFGNRHRADALERQAENISARFLRGEKNFSRQISPTAAADFHVSGSQGMPLSSAVREEMQVAFNADFGAVRIHTGATADAVSCEHGADAFASGRDIYFRTGLYDPATDSGKRLLAHELVHVLQQTGRRNSKGELIASSVSGSGDVQRSQSLTDFFTDRGLFTTTPPVETVFARHTAENPSDTDLQAHIATIKGILGQTTATPTPAEQLLTKALEEDFITKTEHSALYFDVLKQLGDFDKARRAASFVLPNRTAFGLIDLYSKKLKGDLSWMEGTINGSALLAKYFKKRFVDTFRIHLFGPARVPQDLGFDRKFKDVFEEQLTGAAEPTALIDNERRFFALAALKKLDDFRVQLLEENSKREKREDAITFRVDNRRAFAMGLAQPGKLEELGAIVELPEESTHLLSLVADEIRLVATDAADFWERVGEFDRLRREGGEFETFGDILKLLAEIKDIKEVKNLETDLLRVAKAAFYLPAGKTPSIDTYKSLMTGQADALMAVARNYDTKIFAMARDEAASKAIDEKTFIQLGWVQWFILAIAFNMRQFVPPALPAKATAEDKRLREDELVKHRLQMARWWLIIAYHLKMEKLREFLTKVYLGEQEGQKQSQLALFGTWELDEESSLTLMSKEFPKGPMRGVAPLTGADIANFCYLLYAQDLAFEIWYILDIEGMGTDLSGTKPPVINQALDRVKKKDHPKRYLMKDYVAAVIPSERDQFGKLVEAHPKFKEFISSASSKDVIVVPSELSKHQASNAIVLWTVPRLSELVDLLAANVPGLDLVVRAQMAINQTAYEAALAKAKKGQEPEPLGEEWFQWLKALEAVVKADPTLEAKIHDAIKAGQKTAVDALNVEARRATTHQRHTILLQQLLKLWGAYDSANYKTFTKPNDAVSIMIDFASRVSPPSDGPYQMAALMLELGPLLYAKLGPQQVLMGVLETVGTTRFDLIYALLPHLDGTIRLCADSQKLAVVKSLGLSVPLGFDVHLDTLKKLKTQTEQSQIEMQLKRELIVNKESQTIAVAGWGYVLHTGAENAFTIDGRQYELVEVYQTFSFVPEVTISAGGIDWPESELGTSLLTWADGTVSKKADRKGTKLFKIMRDGVEIDVLDTDERLLSEVTHVVSTKGFVQAMEELGAALEVFAEILMTGMEFVPGIGPPLMVARVFTAIMMFIGSPQFTEIKEALGGDTGKLAELAIEKLKAAFTADVLWNFVLFGEPAIPTLSPPEQTAKQKKVTQRHGKGSAAQRLAAIIGRILRIAGRLGISVKRLNDKFQYPMRRTEVFVISHPLIALVLNFIVENFERLSALKLSDLSLSPEETKKKVTDEVGKLSERVTEMLEHVRSLELPQELIPLEQIIDLVVELVIERLPGRYKLVTTLVRAGLQLVHLWDKIVSAVARQMKAANMDPNILWQDLIRAKLEPIFEELCAEFATAAGSTLEEVPFLKGISKPVGPEVQFELEPGEFPEVQEWLSEHAVSHPPPLLSWPRTSGTRLDPPLMRDASRRYGHDLSHVRLHTGPDAAAVTASMGAEGLTSGSHVYLRPGLSPKYGMGADVFHHELSHVIQQTGSRPLGVRHSSDPVAGAQRRQVRHDTSLEAAADRSASRAQASPIADHPLNPGSTNIQAPQPKLDRLMKTFFTKIGADQPLVERTKDIEADKGGPKGLRLSSYGNRVVSELPAKLKKAITDLEHHKTSFPGYLEPIHKDVIDYLIGNHWSKIDGAMTQLVKRAHEGKNVKTTDGSGVVKEKVEWTFMPARLEQEIEEFIFGLSGLLFDLEFNLEPVTGGSSPTLKQVDLTNPIKTFKPLSLHLAYVGGTASLWKQVVKNTWVTHFPKIVPPSRFKNTSDFPKQDDAIATYQLNARMMLRDAGPQPKVFMSSEFRFSDWFAKQVEDSVFSVAGGSLSPSAISKWDDYKSPTATATNYSTTYGHIHLAFGTYAERAKPGAQWGVARNAHHTTQYLILEYLKNRKTDQKPFKHALKNYPGVVGSGSLVNTIAKPGNTRTINVGTYEEARGGKMPTILISEHAHQQGGVHVHGKPDEAPGTSSPSTPGFSVHNEFRKGLGDFAPIMFDPTPLKLQAIQKQTKGEPVPAGQEVTVKGAQVTSDNLQDAIFSAACSSYKWMRDDMSSKLKTALKVEETHYYETMVRRHMQDTGNPNYLTAPLPTGYVPVDTDMNTVADEAEKHNKSIMEDPAKVGFES